MTDTERSFGEQGLHEALGRLKKRLANSSFGDPLISVAEALEWSYALQEYHIGQIAVPGKISRERAARIFDTPRRSSGTNGEVHGALAWVRGESTHALLSGVSLVPTKRGPKVQRFATGTMMILPAVFDRGWRWKRLDQLQKQTDNYGRDGFYESHVAGKDTLPPLEAAERFLLAYP